MILEYKTLHQWIFIGMRSIVKEDTSILLILQKQRLTMEARNSECFLNWYDDDLGDWTPSFSFPPPLSPRFIELDNCFSFRSRTSWRGVHSSVQYLPIGIHKILPCVVYSCQCDNNLHMKLFTVWIWFHHDWLKLILKHRT